MLALTIISIVLLFLEFLTLTFGISVMFPKINSFQILIHFVGVVHMTIMILVRFSYTQMRSILFFYVILPFILEVSVIFLAYGRFKIMDFIMERKQKRKNLLDQEILKRDSIKTE